MIVALIKLSIVGPFLVLSPVKGWDVFLFNYRLTVLKTMVKPYAVTEMFL